MHDPHAVTVVECAQQLVQVAADIEVGECLVQLLEVGVVDVLEYEGGGAGHGVLHHPVEGYNIGAAAQVF